MNETKSHIAMNIVYNDDGTCSHRCPMHLYSGKRGEYACNLTNLEGKAITKDTEKRIDLCLSLEEFFNNLKNR